MKKSGENYISISEIWPQERDYLERPERFKYVRKIIKSDGCVFCVAREKFPKFESLCVYKSAHSMVVLNKYPYNTGHLLILPLRHCGDLSALSAEEFTDLMDTLRQSFAILRKVYETSQGFNMGLNHGAVAGAGIPDHLHWHIVPRWSGDTNFFPLLAETKVLPESLEQSFNKLKPHFEELNT